jgi:mono/diheme cytochrome c family protein
MKRTLLAALAASFATTAAADAAAAGSAAAAPGTTAPAAPSGTAGPATPAAKGTATGDRVARGKYLVERVGMCADCHSPRNERGEFVKAQWLWGSPLGFKPEPPIPGWAPVAPPIAGLVGWTDEQAVRLLTTRKNRDGRLPGPPMPEYALSRADAEGVVAYLRSLPPPPDGPAPAR